MQQAPVDKPEKSQSDLKTLNTILAILGIEILQ